MKKYLFLLSLPLFFIACGEDSASGPVKSSSADMEVSTSSENFSVNSDSFTDFRDGKKYRTVTIGSQTWMAENLALEYRVDGNAYGTFYNARVKQHYYTWAAAMDSAAVFSADGEGCCPGLCYVYKSNIRGICPEGWHLPNKLEWKALIEVAENSGFALEAKGFVSSSNDKYGFSALPVGYYRDGSFYHIYEGDAYFWSASSGDAGPSRPYQVYYFHLRGSIAEVNSGGSYGYGYSVRCIKDE